MLLEAKLLALRRRSVEDIGCRFLRHEGSIPGFSVAVLIKRESTLGNGDHCAVSGLDNHRKCRSRVLDGC